MYFFDIEEYWEGFDSNKWANTGVSDVNVGCAGGPRPKDWEDLFSTARALRDSFFKNVSEWFIESGQSGYTENIDQGCSPTYLDLWVNYIEKKVEWEILRTELTFTINLYRFNYDYLTQDPEYKTQYPTYTEWFESTYNDFGQRTGTTIENINEVINPFPPRELSAVTVTFNYGTSFENSDLITKITNYENAMKELMCTVKNMISIMDGDTFDELVVDDNGNFLPNSGYTYNMI